MRKMLLLLATLCLLSVPAFARNVMIILHNGSIVKGDMLGASDSVLFLNEKGTAREINLETIKAVFDARTNQPIPVPPPSSPARQVKDSKAEANSRFPAAGKKPDVIPPPGNNLNVLAGYFEIFGYATLSNGYAIGKPLQTWIDDDIASGSPAFMNIGGTLYLGMDPENTLFLGAGASVNMPPSHSIWGSNLYYGGRTELTLDPYIFSIDMPLRYLFKDSGISLTVEPSLLMAFLSGKYSTSGYVNFGGQMLTGTFYTNMGSMGIGFGLSAGAEWHLGMFGVCAKLGFRMLQSALNFDSTAGPWSPVDSNGQPINVDLGGTYMTIGILMDIGGE